jgi:hypothetical protein
VYDIAIHSNEKMRIILETHTYNTNFRKMKKSFLRKIVPFLMIAFQFLVFAGMGCFPMASTECSPFLSGCAFNILVSVY